MSPSIAVLPFVSSDKDQEYFGEGLAEEIINALSRIDGLRVAARASAFHFKERPPPLREVGESLSVTTALLGSVETARGRIQLSVALVNVADERSLWSGSYDSEVADVFDIQDEITRKIVETLSPGSTPPSIRARHGAGVEAYQLYLAGKHHWYSRYEGGLNIAIGLFEQARAKAPNYALANAGLADSYSVLGLFGFLPPKIAFPRSRAAVQKALSLDSSLAEAHASLGLIQWWFDWNAMGAERSFKRALELNPSYVTVHSWYGSFLAGLGREDEATLMTERALALDPLSPHAHTMAGTTFRLMHRYEDAIRACERALAIDPSFLLAMYNLGWSLAAAGALERARAELEKVANHSGRFPLYVGCLGWAYGLSGLREEAVAIVNELLERERTDDVTPISLAYVFMGLGDNDGAFRWLEAAYQARSGFITIANRDPIFDTVRGDARFHDLLRRIGLAAL